MQMARMTNAEKQRRYRERMKSNEETRIAYLERERQRWNKRVADGKVKKIKDMSVREQRSQRRKWRDSQRRSVIMAYQ